MADDAFNFDLSCVLLREVKKGELGDCLAVALFFGGACQR